MKKCSICKEKKELNLFDNNRCHKDGKASSCKPCNKIKRETIEQKEKQKNWNKNFSIKNKKRLNEKAKKYRIENKEKIKTDWASYYKKNKEKLKEKRRIYFKNNKDLIYLSHNKWKNKNKKQLNAKKNQNEKNKKKENPLYKLNTTTLIGCSFEFAKKWIEKKFTKGMSWSNYGEWHIDHIIPFNSAKTEEDLTKLCHYTNLQPLWAKDNLSKNDNIFPTQMVLTI